MISKSDSNSKKDTTQDEYANVDNNNIKKGTKQEEETSKEHGHFSAVFLINKRSDKGGDESSHIERRSEKSEQLTVKLAILIGGGIESLFAINRREEEFEKRITPPEIPMS